MEPPLCLSEYAALSPLLACVELVAEVPPPRYNLGITPPRHHARPSVSRIVSYTDTSRLGPF